MQPTAQPIPPDSVEAIRRLRKIFPDLTEALITAFQFINQREKKFPNWREVQIVQLIKTVNLLASDLEERFQAHRIDQLASAARNLLELHIWTQYCSVSEKNARIFFDDAPRDMREVLHTMQKFYAVTNGTPQAELAALQNTLRQAATTSGVTDFDDSYFKVHDAAEKLGQAQAFKALYKVFSKFAHPSALLILVEQKSNPMLAAFLVSGQQAAVACVETIKDCIVKVYPVLG